MLLSITGRIYKRSHRELGCLWMHIHISSVKSEKKKLLSDISKKRFDFFVGVLDFSACSEPILYVQIRIDIPPHLCINNLEALQINGFWRNRHIFPTTPQKPKYRHRHSKNSKITNLSNLQLIDMSVFRVFALLTRSFVYLWHNQSPNNYWTFRVKKNSFFFQLARQLHNVSLESWRRTLLILNEALRGLWSTKHPSLRENKTIWKTRKSELYWGHPNKLV